MYGRTYRMPVYYMPFGKAHTAKIPAYGQKE